MSTVRVHESLPGLRKAVQRIQYLLDQLSTAHEILDEATTSGFHDRTYLRQATDDHLLLEERSRILLGIATLDDAMLQGNGRSDLLWQTGGRILLGEGGRTATQAAMEEEMIAMGLPFGVTRRLAESGEQQVEP